MKLCCRSLLIQIKVQKRKNTCECIFTAVYPQWKMAKFKWANKVWCRWAKQYDIWFHVSEQQEVSWKFSSFISLTTFELIYIPFHIHIEHTFSASTKIESQTTTINESLIFCSLSIGICSQMYAQMPNSDILFFFRVYLIRCTKMPI